MRIDVYPSDVDVYEATAACVVEHLTGERPTLGVGGGRTARGVLLALAGRSDLPSRTMHVALLDERCVPPDDMHATQRLVREALAVPRGIAPERVHGVAAAGRTPAAGAAAYAAELAAVVGPSLALDVAVVTVGAGGALGPIEPGAEVLARGDHVGVVEVHELTRDPRLPAVVVTPAVLAGAGHVVVVAVGGEVARGVAHALHEPADPRACPLQALMPGTHVTWLVDRAAAGELLRNAQPVADGAT